MPPTKKAKKSPPIECKKLVQPALTDMVAILQENIRLKAKEVREPIKTGKTVPSTSGRKAIAVPVAKSEPTTSKTVNAVEIKPGPSSSGSGDAALADNPYAREIFFCKTNVREIARQAVKEQKNYTDPTQIKAAAKDFRYRLFRTYVEKPHFRIREPLHKLRFESEYYEYRLHLALAMGMQCDEDYQDFKEQLDAAGLNESWVQMHKDNLLLVHEKKVLKTVQAKFQHWGAKLVKLPEYLMQAQRNYEAKHPATVAAANCPPEPQLDPLLDALINRSNARERLVDIKELYNFLATNPPRFVCHRSLRWLVFKDDTLNQRFGLGPHADDASQSDDEDDHEMESETIIGITALDHSSTEVESVHSENSEIAQMRSEMAMTQPDELKVPNVGAGDPFFQNTEEVITALEPTQQAESFASVPVDPLLPPVDPVVPSLVPPKDPLIRQDDSLVVNELQDATKQDEPMLQQPEALAITAAASVTATAPAGHIQSSGEEGSEFSLLTPGQQEVISISDDEDYQHRPEADRSSNSFSDEIKMEEGFWADVENLKRYTNINEFVASVIRLKFKNNQQKIGKRMAKLDEYVKLYVEEHKDQFRKNVLPKGVVKLTRRARREREAVSQASMQQAPGPMVQLPVPVAAVAVPVATTQSLPPVATPAVTTTMQSPSIPAPITMQSPPVVSALEPLFNGALSSESQLETPRHPVPMKIRRIDYEDSPLILARDSLELMPMPDSENFQPQVHSTQNTFGGPMISAAPYPGTPRPSPRKQQQSSPRRSPRSSPQQRPSVDNRSSTPFADENLNDTVQKQSPRKRRSPQVKAEPNHSGYEGEVEVVPINDDPIELEDTQSESQIDAMALIEREDGFGVPSGMRNRMNRLFKNQSQQLDVTQASQTPEKDGGGGGRRLSLDRQSLGFRNSQSPLVRSD